MDRLLFYIFLYMHNGKYGTSAAKQKHYKKAHLNEKCWRISVWKKVADFLVSV